MTPRILRSLPLAQQGCDVRLPAALALLLLLLPAAAAAGQEVAAPSGTTQDLGPEAEGADDLNEPGPGNPFRHRIPVPEFPRGVRWMNSAGPLKMADLRGKFVLVDFWTYCCINCMHVLPELKKLEHAYPKQLVVIGVHSAKFETEKLDENIREAILRYDIEHPVINDSKMRIWRMFGARSWPTLLMIDPEGNAVYMRSGEFRFEEIDAILKASLPFYRAKQLLDETPVHFDTLANRQPNTPLRFPGKVVADETTRRLFISDSNHHRIVVTDLEGRNPVVIGAGQPGADDGPFAEATFRYPQGMALDGERLWVADTENHLLREINFKTQRVSTIAGTGSQGRNAWPGWKGDPNEIREDRRWLGDPAATALNSPWDLWVHGEHLFIAMAGPHQIWQMPLDASSIGPFAGNGREDIVDGPRLPVSPYALGAASFAQPSGLSSDGRSLYVADSEGSSIRAVALDRDQPVRTITGPNHLPVNRLFEFGDRDGTLAEAKLQHPLAVAYRRGKLYVADTYNNKIKVIDLDKGRVTTLVGDGSAGATNQPPRFNEPSGLAYAAGRLFVADTNNHKIRVIDLHQGNQVTDLQVEGLAPPTRPAGTLAWPGDEGAIVQELPRKTVPSGVLRLTIDLQLGEGYKLNPDVPIRWNVELTESDGPELQAPGSPHRQDPGESPLTITATIGGRPGPATLKVSAIYYYCKVGAEGLCRLGHGVWRVPIQVSSESGPSAIELRHQHPDLIRSQ